MDDRLPVLWIVIPCFNEGSAGGNCLTITAPLFLQELTHLIATKRVSDSSQICFIDDGSSDDTWSIIEQLSRENNHFRGIRLSRNRGHQNALLAGLIEAIPHCDLAVSMDCDGQDDITAVEKMVDAASEGYEVVYGVRSKRETDTPFKRITAESFYRLMEAMGADVVFNHADYRLMSARALEGLSQFTEANLFLRGLVPLVGYPSTSVEYERTERKAGSSHYPLKKMLGLALDGITSLSIKPIRFISGLGIVFSLLGLIGVIWALLATITGNTVTGWASTMCAISLIGGLQLLCLGVIGEYVGKIYLEVKRRPRYIIAERTWTEGERDY